MRNTLRFNPPKKWLPGETYNIQLMGLFNLIGTVSSLLKDITKETKMLEIGSFMGESTFLFASMGIFNEVHCIEPFSGDFNEYKDYGDDWNAIKREFWTNTRFFKDKIHLHQDFSYNMVDKFEDETFDMVYIDAYHDYKSVKDDLLSYLPKVKKGGIIAGHDYHDNWPGVKKAINEILGKPDFEFVDNSWLVKKKE
jgi:hypothetical protein